MAFMYAGALMGKSNVEVLISAMHQKDFSIAKKTGIESDCLIINQCDKDDVAYLEHATKKIRCISTKQRGLSRSRNMALDNANGCYCLLADDDETLYNGYESKILQAYDRNPKADVICFQVKSPTKKYSQKECKVGYIKALKMSSWQITFNRAKVVNSCIHFDEKLGSGTPQGYGEENKFLYDCLRKGLNIYYVPICIGEVMQTDSKWFHGYNEHYFVQCGTVSRRILGTFFGFLYCLYTAFTKRNLYISNVTMLVAMKNMFRGFLKKL